MSESGFNLPKQAAAQMVNDFFLKDSKNLKTVYNTYTTGSKSLREQSVDAIKEFSNDISPAMKRMKVDYLEKVQGECYQQKHISDNFTNVEQISLCKSEKHNEVFGTFETNLRNYRESDRIRLTHCVTDAGDEIEMLSNCFQKYVTDIRQTNKTLKNIFVEGHKEYL